METTEKIYDVKKLKETIKVAANYQRFLRNQRKTVKIQGSRQVEPWVATMKHHQGRENLRTMYAAYAVMSGKEISEIDSLKFDPEWLESSFKQKVNDLLEKYKLKVEAES